MKYPKLVLIALCAVVVQSVSGCKSTTPPLRSEVFIAAPTVDGNIDDWGGHIRKADKQPFSLGVTNDADFLYVSMVTSDASTISQVQRNGMNLWLDPTGSKGEEFGVRFPTGIVGVTGRQQTRESLDHSVREEMVAASFEATTQDLILLGVTEEGLVVRRDGVPGITAMAKYTAGTFVYEIKVPLQATEEFPYAVGASPGDIIAFGFQTPKQEGVDRRRGSESELGTSGGGRGGRGGSGGRRSGGRDGGGRSADVADPEPVKYWQSVELAVR